MSDASGLINAVQGRDAAAVQAALELLPPNETAWALSRMDEGERRMLIELLDPEEAADLLLELSDEQAADLLEEASADDAAAIVEQMPASDQADLLSDVDPEHVEAILEAMSQEDGAVARKLMEYPEDTAGGLMDVRFLAFPQEKTIAQVLDDLRANVDTYSDYEVQYVYVTGGGKRLTGVLRLRDMVMTRPSVPIGDIMIETPISLLDQATLPELRDFFKEHTEFLGVPVTDEDGRLVGVVRRSAVKEAEEEEATSLFLRLSGIVAGEEFRSMPMSKRSMRRLTWLGPNIVLNMIAASVIAMFQDTLQAAIALAVFLPIISDMSGCSGNQAVAVSIRELTLGLLRPAEVRRVLLKEAGLGLINGTLLGLLLAIVAFVWQGNPWLGLVVGVALAANTILSVSLGGLVPLLLRRLKVDPALASGPILTTMTDMCGFFLVLGLATMTLPLLTS